MNEQPMCPKCGSRTCQNPHNVSPWQKRDRDEKWQPAWLKRLQAKDMTGSLR